MAAHCSSALGGTDSQLLECDDNNASAARREDDDDDGMSGQLPPSGGSSRQTKRLRLRNAGFRGAAVPTRKATPKLAMSSSAWSSCEGSSGAENVPPSNADVCTPSLGHRRKTSGVLVDIGNSTASRSTKGRLRSLSGGMSDSDGGAEEKSYAGTHVSQLQGKGGVCPRAVKTRVKVSHRRRSVSAETSKYIEHLETELAVAQSQLSKVNSPTVTRQQSSKMRNLDAETKLLQKELQDWEAKYELRVQEEADRFYEIETGLRNRIRVLEQDVDEGRLRTQQLVMQLEENTQNMEAVEAANVNLERRIEIMSEILAASPSKIDLHVEPPGRARRHIRPKSMLPRFPTASSLLGSPERQPRTQPTSPLLTFTNYSPHIPSSPTHSVCRLDNTSQQSEYISEAESVFSEASVNGDSMTSTEPFDAQPTYGGWILPPALPQNRVKPARRMRRFGAGSFGPKPLILPSTAHCDSFNPVSAPALERSETTPAFFPDEMLSSHGSRSPLIGRRRASTMANGEKLAALDSSPFLDAPLQDCGDETLRDLEFSSSSPSCPSATRDLSSFGSVKGRSLMDELTAVCTNESSVSGEGPIEGHEGAEGCQFGANEVEESHMLGEGTHLEPTPIWPSKSRTAPSSLTALAITRHSNDHSQSPSPTIIRSFSILERLRFLFGDLWTSPFDLARHLIQTAHFGARTSPTLLNLRYWLIGALLGPMARRRMLSSAHTSDSRTDEESQLLKATPERASESGRMAYGTIHETPPPSSPSRKSGGSVSSVRRKRAGHKVRCPHRRAKHSPLLWLKFTITLAFAVGAAVKEGPESLLRRAVCECQRVGVSSSSRRVSSEGEEGEEGDGLGLL